MLRHAVPDNAADGLRMLTNGASNIAFMESWGKVKAQHVNLGKRLDRDLTPDLTEIARIFAGGILRTHQQGALPAGHVGISPETALESSPQDLEQSAESRLSVTKVYVPRAKDQRENTWH
jgi:hypothetical protein